MSEKRIRIYMTGVGGQGTLTATTLLARAALDQGLDVVAGEVHGMAQRGGVVESVVLLGGWKSPKLVHGEADVIMGFEPLETLRGLAYLAPGGCIFSSSDAMPPLGVSMGKEHYPPLEEIRQAVNALTPRNWFISCRELGREAGSLLSGNTALLGAVCASGVLPLGTDALAAAIRKYLPAKIQEANLKALELGAQALGTV